MIPKVEILPIGEGQTLYITVQCVCVKHLYDAWVMTFKACGPLVKSATCIKMITAIPW
jgi:hypothetical protein